MSIYHCSIKIISRSGGRTAVASAAYRSGEKLRNEETGLIHDFTKKRGVILNEIILPEHAPERYRNRESLWNEVQKIEKRSDAQFAREVEVALPAEIKRDNQIECVRNYIKENFVSKGMIADWALHDTGNGNPHAHIMLTMRGIDEHEKWLQKQKTVFANSRDKEGRPIYDPRLPAYDSKDKEGTSQYRIPVLDSEGNQKMRIRKGKGKECLWEKISIPANDWNEHSNAEIWRASWAEHCNRYLGQENRIDHRSYARRGINLEPTIHEGVVARDIEKSGKTAERCQINREIRERNSILMQLKEIGDELTKLVIEKARGIYERLKRLKRVTRDSGKTERDDDNLGKTTEGNRESGRGKPESEKTGRRNREAQSEEPESGRRTRRIDEFKRVAIESGGKIEQTDREIEGTDRRIEELRLEITKKEKERDERLKRLRERRNAHSDGGNPDGERGASEREQRAGERKTRSSGNQYGAGVAELRSTADDIGSFFAELEAAERASEEKRDDRIAEREDREAERQRSHIEKERRIEKTERRTEKTERRTEAERRGNKKKGRGNGISL